MFCWDLNVKALEKYRLDTCSMSRLNRVNALVGFFLMYHSSPEQVLSQSQALLVVLLIDDVMRWLQMVLMFPCISAQGWMWMWVLGGTAPGGGQRQMMMPEEEAVVEVWRLRSYRWSSTTLQEPK